MPIHFNVDPNQPDILRWEFIGKWTLEEYHTLNDEANRLIRARTPQPFYGIVDTTKSASPPANAIMMLTNTLRRAPENWAMTVVIAKSEFIRQIFAMTERLQPSLINRYRVVSTLQEAEELIQAHRAAVSDLSR